MFVDTHCHLTMMVSRALDKKVTSEELIAIKGVVQEASTSVSKIITVGTTYIDSVNAVEVAQACEGVWASIGIHPCDGGPEWKSEFKLLEKLAQVKKVVALGETGLDFYHKPFDKNLQVDLFIAHIECAIKYQLPIILHIRDSADEVLKILERYKKVLKGVAHCFSQDQAIADILLEWGFYLGIGGPITYPKNEALRKIFAAVPLQKIILETDAPFLPPQAFRGKQNHPKYIPLIAEVIAQLHEVDVEEVGKITSANVSALFGI